MGGDVDLPDVGEPEEIGQPLAPPEQVVQRREEADGTIRPSSLSPCRTVVAAQRWEVAGQRVVLASHVVDLEGGDVPPADTLGDDLASLRRGDLAPPEAEVAQLKDPVRAEVLVQEGRVRVRDRDLLGVA